MSSRLVTNTIINLIASFMDIRAYIRALPSRNPLDYTPTVIPHPIPYWGHEMIPLPSQEAILRRWKLSSTATLLDKRKANLLGNLIRHYATPHNDITQNVRADWWKQCTRITTHMKVSLEQAHSITFWKSAVKKLGSTTP